MSGQANMLEDLIAQFKLRDTSKRFAVTSSPQTKTIEMPEKSTLTGGDGGDYGKY
jgi:hypothetical protein